MAWHGMSLAFSSPGATTLSRYLGSLGLDSRGYESHYSGEQAREGQQAITGPRRILVTRAENFSGIGVGWASETYLPLEFL